jgi:hypothetical protein
MLYTIKNPIRCFHKKEGKLQIVFYIFFSLASSFICQVYVAFLQTMTQSVDAGAAVPNPRVSFIANTIVCNGILHASGPSHLISSVS